LVHFELQLEVAVLRAFLWKTKTDCPISRLLFYCRITREESAISPLLLVREDFAGELLLADGTAFVKAFNWSFCFTVASCCCVPLLHTSIAVQDTPWIFLAKVTKGFCKAGRRGLKKKDCNEDFHDDSWDSQPGRVEKMGMVTAHARDD